MASTVPVVSPASPLPTTTPADSPASSAATASTSKTGLRPDGPAYPSSFSPGGRSQHSRRPSRAERYEALVSGARDILRRGSVGLQEIGLGFEQPAAEGQSAEPVNDRDWRDAVRNLLKVVDGMSQQLSTHDELSKELKVAQSSLLLAESHSEFLEETIRRRDSRSSHTMGRHLSNGGMAPPLPRSRGTTDDEAGSGSGMFGLGLSNDDTASNGNGGGKGFFRLPSKRKPTPSTASIASTSTTSSMPPPNPPFAQTLRSVSSSPRLGDYSPNPAPPSMPHPRFSTSTTASSVDDLSPVVPSLGTAASSFTDGSSPPSAADLFALQSHVSSLENECTALRSNNASLKRNNETLVGKCAELEKTKEDLMSELENLSVELFSEANTLVAEERRARAKADEEVARLRAEIDSLNSQLTILRQLIASRKSSNASSIANLDLTSPDLPAIPSFEPETPPMSISSTLDPYSDSPARLPFPAAHAAGIERPVSSVSVASTSSSSGRKWFSFGRSSSHSTTPETLPSSASGSTPVPPHGQKPTRSASHPAPSDSLRPPEMQRGDSNSSHYSDASATSFFSFRSGATGNTAGASPDLAGRSSAEEERSTKAGGGKGKEKARELDLGIYIPGGGPIGMAKTDSEGGRTIGLKTPVTADYTRDRDGQVRREALPSPSTVAAAMTRVGEGGGETPEFIGSPPLPPLPPATPHIPSSTSLPTSPTSSSCRQPPPSAAAPSTTGSTTPTLAPPTARQPRSGVQAARPLAIHTSLTPPLLSSGGQFSPLDPAALGFPGDVGGPRASDMTAASKSPKSPNALRWNEVAGTLASSERERERRPRSRSNSRARSDAGNGGWEREKLPPSPALPVGFKEQQQQQPLRPPPTDNARARPPSPVPPPRPPPPSSPTAPAPAPGKLRIDTASPAVSVPPALAGGVKALVLGSGGGPLSARPASPAVADPRPSLARAASSTGVPPKSAGSSHAPPPRSLASAIPLAPSTKGSSVAPSPTVSTFPRTSSATAASAAVPGSVPALRPGFLRANSSASVGSGGGGGMSTSTSASSLASTATAGTSSSSGTAGGGGGKSRSADGHAHAHGHGRPLSPDGTKAVEDLESLMASILAMDGEGVFEGGAGGAGAAGGKGEAK
ncbi:hypothetical protein JCM6882_000395 [Rhodosporidiobolus microsporus]